MIAAPRQRVWEALIDPQVMRRCIPGCEDVIRRGDTAFEARVLTRVGPLRARFSGRVDLCEIDAPAGCTLKFEGGAGAVGMATGQSRVTLQEVTGGTLLRYATEAAIGGKLNQIGGRLIDASARKMADDFFRAFNDQLAGDQLAGDPLPDPSPTAPPGPAAAPSPVAAPPGPAAAAVAGWTAELQRLLWLATGALFGGAVGYLLHI
ncbi:CoxG family protein [Azospirillum sp. ST 5-10]|uniref:CoxG family protein n=1 Tax=unclassified Azospirillum TaxID=2630922 RepID=UPI003F4A28AA